MMVRKIPCPTCGVAAGQACRGLSGARISYTHRARREAAVEKNPPTREGGRRG